MILPILSIGLVQEPDIVSARQRARQIAGLLGFDSQQQTRLATAVSEIARNAVQYAGGGRIEFGIEAQAPQSLIIRIIDRGPGIRDLDRILRGEYSSRTGMGFGIVGARRLMDIFEIESPGRGGVTVTLGKFLPRKADAVTSETVSNINAELARRGPHGPLEELRDQNRDLMRALDELRQRQDELVRLNRELDDTNRGVVALYAELDEQADHLRRASEVKTRFLSNMTHEFRTPLNSILALTRLLLDGLDGELTAEQEKQVHFIRRSAESLSDLVNDLLDLTKVEAGKIVIRPAEFEVHNVFAALRGMLRPMLLNTTVNLVFEDPEGIPPMYTDEAKVSQIVRNFISNALKFTQQGEVRVCAKLAANGRAAIFSVADTGIGIAPEHHTVIFQEFTQLDSPLQRKVRGTGLGLPLSKKLAELLGGTVTVESQLGIGSTFSATIPLVYPGDIPETDVLLPPDSLDQARLPVLVIEDEIETRLLYEKYLRGTAFQPVPARALREARTLLESIRPAAIILDILLRGEESWGLLSELKAAAQTRDIPILVVTNIEDREKAMALGADAFCQKPFERRWLLDQLHLLTGRRSPRKVLLIDEDEVSRYLLRQLFPAHAGQVLEAVNGAEGVRFARDEQPHLIVLDLLMPGVGGFEVLDQLRSDPATSGIPVIVCSAKPLNLEEEARIKRETAGFLRKSALSEGTGAAELRSLCDRAGLAGLLEETSTVSP